MHPDTVITNLAVTQHGVVGRRQLRAAGLSDAQITRRVANGRLEVVHRGVLHVAGVPVTDDTRHAAACVAAGPGSFVAIRSAAAMAGLPVAPPPGGAVDVMRFCARPPERPGLLSHECDELWTDDVVEVRGIPVTSVARTLVDLGVAVPWRDALERALDDALGRRIVTIDEVDRVLRRRRGRRGTALMRALVAERGTGFRPADSRPAEALARAIEARGLRVARDHPVDVGGRTFYVDVAVPDVLIAAEWDGLDVHGTRSAIVRDAWRRNHLTERGWRVLVFTRGVSAVQAAAQVARTARERGARCA